MPAARSSRSPPALLPAPPAGAFRHRRRDALLAARRAASACGRCSCWPPPKPWPARDGERARDDALPAACAVEMIHTYSLIHDDLPAMDDDSLRRGRPTSHVVHGEGMAILAGDGLQAEAFAVLARWPASRRSSVQARKLRTLLVVAEAAGAAGMVGGQAIDLAADPAHARAGRESVPDAARRRGAERHARAQDRRPDPGVGAGRRHHGAAPTTPRSTRSIATPARSAWRSRSWTTSWTWRAHRRIWARPRARTPPRASRPTCRSMGWTARRRAPPPASSAPGRARRARAGRLAPRGHRPLDRRAPHMTTRMRLDALLVHKGLVESREKARALILAGQVDVGGHGAAQGRHHGRRRGRRARHRAGASLGRAAAG